MSSIGIIDADSIIYILCYSNKEIDTFSDFINVIDSYCNSIENEIDCDNYVYVKINLSFIKKRKITL